MNNQVKAFFVRSAYKKLYEQYLDQIPYQPSALEKYLNLVLEATHGVDLQISDDDLEFVHSARLLSHHQHAGEAVPTHASMIMARYLLAHELPLHHFEMEWDEHMQKMHIVETYPRPDGGEKTHTFAVVNDQMRKHYEYSTKKKVAKGEAGDREVANWWTRTFQNAVFKAPEGADKKNGGNPVPVVTIVRKGSDSVDLSFRQSGPKPIYREIRNIPVDMEKFRKQLTDQGFDFAKHPSLMLRQTRQTWDKLLDSEKNISTDPDQNNKDPKTGLKKPRRKNPTFSPGYNIPWEKVDKEVMKKYENEIDFRRSVEQALVKAVSVAYQTVAQTSVKIAVDWDNDNAIGDDSQYRIKISNKSMPGLDEDGVRDILQSARVYLFGNSAHGDLADKDFLRLTAGTGARSALNKVYNDKLRKAQDVGGGAESGGKGDGGRAGGRMQIAATGGAGGGAGGAGTDVNLRQGAGANKIGRVGGFQQQDYKSAGRYTPEDLLSHIADAGIASVRDDEAIQQNVFNLAKSDPKIAQIANIIRSKGWTLPAVYDPEAEDDDDDTDSGLNKFAPSARPVHAHESFRDYIAKRDGINEMEVVWGNDKKSANKIKPGETLKGGIQVQGAPWSVGGKGDKNNELKVR